MIEEVRDKAGGLDFSPEGGVGGGAGEKTDVTAVVPLEESIQRLPQELAVPNGKVFIKPN